MKLNRATHDPGQLMEFYDEGLSALGALCERTWHDRLEVVAEGRAATLWSSPGALHEVELHFTPADTTSARDAACEVFPGCPLTFQLAEALRPRPLALERFVLPEGAGSRPPDAAVAEKLWRHQFAETTRWQLAAPFEAGVHFSLIAVARCEIQAMDQHWSLHRLALSLPGGEADEALARDISFHQESAGATAEVIWPALDPARWRQLLQLALENEVAGEVARVRARQENSLRRELERIDDYFENYEQELTARAKRSSNENTRTKPASRRPVGAPRDSRSPPRGRAAPGCRKGLARATASGAGTSATDHGRPFCSPLAPVGIGLAKARLNSPKITPCPADS